jgi:hypothetical protein
MFELSIVFFLSNWGLRKGTEFFSIYKGFRLIEVPLYLEILQIYWNTQEKKMPFSQPKFPWK